jgi:DNA-binding NarL/FixJ family response regulator
MSNQERIRILCVEDHPLTRAGIAVVINGQTDMELVAQASNGHDATECYREHEPDVTLMDLTLSDMSGIEAMIAIRARFPEAGVIIPSTFAGSVQITRAMAAGARSYTIKNMSAIEVVAAIHKVHAGKKHIPRKWRLIWVKSPISSAQVSAVIGPTPATVLSLLSRSASSGSRCSERTRP